VKRRFPMLTIFTLAGGLLTAPVLAGAADQVRTRVAGFRQLGAAYKAVADGLRSNDLARVRAASGQIGGASRTIYSWFPRGSGPRPGVKTAARAEIWSRAGDFRTAADAFTRQAQAFQRVAAGGDLNAIKAESRKLGATCKGCHDNFRVASD